MRFRLFALFTLLLSMLAMTAIAQEDNTPTVAELELTATQLLLESSQTADADSSEVQETATPDPFEMTATALILAATQTGEAIGSSPVPVTPAENVDTFAQTATQLIMEASQTAESVIETQDSDDGAESPLGLTLIAFGFVIVVLIIIGAGYAFIASRTNNRN